MWASLPLGKWDLTSLTRDQTWVSCRGRQGFNHWNPQGSSPSPLLFAGGAGGGVRSWLMWHKVLVAGCFHSLNPPPSFPVWPHVGGHGWWRGLYSHIPWRETALRTRSPEIYLPVKLTSWKTPENLSSTGDLQPAGVRGEHGSRWPWGTEGLQRLSARWAGPGERSELQESGRQGSSCNRGWTDEGRKIMTFSKHEEEPLFLSSNGGISWMKMKEQDRWEI